MLGNFATRPVNWVSDLAKGVGSDQHSQSGDPDPDFVMLSTDWVRSETRSNDKFEYITAQNFCTVASAAKHSRVKAQARRYVRSSARSKSAAVRHRAVCFSTFTTSWGSGWHRDPPVRKTRSALVSKLLIVCCSASHLQRFRAF